MAKYDNPIMKRSGLVHINRAATAAGKHATTIGRLVKANKVKGALDGRGWYVDLADLADYFAKDSRTGVVLAEEVRRLRETVIAEGEAQCTSSKAT